MPMAEMLHVDDPRQAIFDKVGDLSGVEIFGTDVLTAIYKRPEKTASGLYMPDQTLSEDSWQGKAFLVLKLGPRAFVSDDNYQFSAKERLKVGDWCAARPSDGFPFKLNTLKGSGTSHENTVEMRIFKDISLKMRIDRPDRVY